MNQVQINNNTSLSSSSYDISSVIVEWVRKYVVSQHLRAACLKPCRKGVNKPRKVKNTA
jgi:hypothetical protein